METPPPPPPPPSNPQTKKNTKGLPPKRGQIKAQIFESLANTIASVSAKAGETLGMFRRGRGDSGSGSGKSTTTGSPPPSSYNSDGNSEFP